VLLTRALPLATATAEHPRRNPFLNWWWGEALGGAAEDGRREWPPGLIGGNPSLVRERTRPFRYSRASNAIDQPGTDGGDEKVH
jgi:hypothetical protein